MKVCKPLKLNKNPASTLPGLRFLSTLALFFLVSCLPSEVVSWKKTTTPRTFADWCLNKANLSADTKYTINALLRVAKTQDCSQADKLLSTRTEVSLNYNPITDLAYLTRLSRYKNQITDLRPLSTLTNLTGLSLYNNQITDLQPLSTLTNLTELWLESNQITNLRPLSKLTNLRTLSLRRNQISDLQPLSTLTNLTGLYLDKNQIADLKPLSTLINLTTLELQDNQITDLKPLSTLPKLSGLYLDNNQMLTDKTCPVKPASICRFVL